MYLPARAHSTAVWGRSSIIAAARQRRCTRRRNAIRPGTMQQSFSGTEEELKQTKNTQPCLYLVDLAAALALEEQGIRASATAGFSLGEIAALAYAGAYTPAEGFQIVTQRGLYMQQASEEQETAMVAVLKLDNETIERLCDGIDNVYPVNYNCPGQTVIAGTQNCAGAV